MKSKFPLQHCLGILDHAINHVEAHPSVAGDTGTEERTAKHILERVLNKMNLKMELSGNCIFLCCSLKHLLPWFETHTLLGMALLCLASDSLPACCPSIMTFQHHLV